jgi:hypothetical protein
MFGTINLNNNNKIKSLLSTDEIRTGEMLDEIYKALSTKYNQIEVNNIFINHGIITNRNSPKFSILSSSNSLSRSLEQASFFSDSYNPQNNLSIIKNNYDTGYPFLEEQSNFDTFYESVPPPQSKPSQFDTSVLVEFQKPFKNDEYTNLPVIKAVENFEDINNQEVTKNYYMNTEDLNNKLATLENEIANIKSKSDIDCEAKINNVKSELNNQITEIKNKSKDSIDNYIKLLTDVLLKNQVITQNEVNNMNRNLSSGLIDLNTVINYLENKKKLAKNLTINYNFDNIYLNKWNAPLPRPPICISDDPIRVKQIDQYSTNFAPFTK